MRTVRVRRGLQRQDLDRDLAVEPGVLAPVEFAHTSGPERADDLVRVEIGPAEDAFSESAGNDIGLREVVPDEEQDVAERFRRGVGQAIPEIQAGRMPAAAELRERGG